MKRITGVLLLVGLCLHPPLVQAEPLKIAVIFAKTGEAAASNALAFYGARFAVNEINDKGGLLGRRIELIEIDNQSTALGSKAAAEKAVKDGVTAVIGGIRSSYALAMAPVLQEAGIPMISPTATTPDLPRIGNYIFRVCYADDFQGAVMAAFAIRDLHVRSAVILTNTGNQYSPGLAKVFSKRFQLEGGTILWEGEYLEGVTDFKDLLRKMQHLRPDVVFIPGYHTDAGTLIKTARELNIKTVFLGGDGWNEEQIYQYTGEAVEGSYTCTHWNRNSPEKKSRTFVEGFEKSYGRITTPTPPLTYDACMLLADAIARAKSLDRAKIRDALAATKGFKGITGNITLDASRTPLSKPAVILKYEKTQMVYIKTIKP